MVCAVYLVVVSFPGGAGGNDKKTRTSLPVLGVRYLSHAPQGEQAKEGGGASPGTKAPAKRALQRGNGRRLSRSFSRMRDARYLGCIEYLPVSGLSIWESAWQGAPRRTYSVQVQRCRRPMPPPRCARF